MAEITTAPTAPTTVAEGKQKKCGATPRRARSRESRAAHPRAPCSRAQRAHARRLADGWLFVRAALRGLTVALLAHSRGAQGFLWQEEGGC